MRRSVYVVAAIALAACESDDDDFAFQRINPENLNTHPAFSHVTTVSGDSRFIYVAGQTDVAPDHVPGANDCRHADLRGQIMGVQENVGHGLAAAGATWDDVVFIRRFVLDVPEYLRVRSDTANPLPTLWENRPPPPSTLLGIVALAEPCYLIEMDVFAAVAEDD